MSTQPYGPTRSVYSSPSMALPRTQNAVCPSSDTSRAPSEDADSPTALLAQFAQIQEQEQARQELTARAINLYRNEQSLRIFEQKEYAELQQSHQELQKRLREFEDAFIYEVKIVILIDGNQMMFQDHLLQAGANGGREAASTLIKYAKIYVQNELGITGDHLDIETKIFVDTRAFLDLTIAAGLVDSPRQTEDFLQGFMDTPSSHLRSSFDVIDVGPGEDRAFTKIYGRFMKFYGDMTCYHILIGCSNEAQYSRLFHEHGTTQVLKRVSFLHGVPFSGAFSRPEIGKINAKGVFRDSPTQIAMSDNSLHRESGKASFFEVYPRSNGVSSPSVPFNGNSWQHVHTPPSSNGSPQLNMPHPLFTTAPMTKTGPAAPPPLSWARTASRAASLPLSDATPPPSSRTSTDPEVILLNRAGQRLDSGLPPQPADLVKAIKSLKLCNTHYLRGDCPYGDECDYRHNYDLKADQKPALRIVARMAPCNKGSSCKDLKCVHGHTCPNEKDGHPFGKGQRGCTFGPQCNFPVKLHGLDLQPVVTTTIRN